MGGLTAAVAVDDAGGGGPRGGGAGLEAGVAEQLSGEVQPPPPG